MPETLPLLVPLPEAWKALGIGRSLGYELMDSGELPSVKIGRRRLIPREDLLAYVAKVTASAGGEF